MDGVLWGSEAEACEGGVTSFLTLDVVEGGSSPYALCMVDRVEGSCVSAGREGTGEAGVCEVGVATFNSTKIYSN